MGAYANIGKGLGVDKPAVLFFEYQNAVIFRIIRQIYHTVAGNGVSAVDFIGHNLPFVQFPVQGIAVNDFIVIAVHQKVGILQLSNIGGDAQVKVGIDRYGDVLFVLGSLAEL